MQRLFELVDPQQLAMMAVGYLPRLLAALAVLFVFWLLLKATRPALRAVFRRADFAEPLIRLLVDNVYRYTVLLFALVMAARQVGIDMGAALTGIGVAGIALGFAAQDSLANTIAGFMIFWDKPFHVGDFVTTQGEYGEVVNITMRTTRIRTRENTYLVIPNKEIIDEPLINHSMFGETRINVPVGIAYKEDIREARRVLLDAIEGIDGVEEEPPPAVVVRELGDSSVNLELRVWIRDSSQERPIFFVVLEAAKLALDAAGIQIPFPHLQLFVDEVEERVWERAQRLRAG